MSLEILIYLILGISFLGSVAVLIVPKENERVIARVTHGMAGIHLIASFLLIGIWLWQGAKPWRSSHFILYTSDDYHFALSFFLDRISVAFLFTVTMICYSITRYALVYLAKDEGYQRFFASMGFFIFGYTLVILADNFEMLFAGWEYLGITSFLLVSFYRYRIRPVKNALKIFTIYRVGDVGLLLGAWLSQLLWHQTLDFDRLSEFAQHVITPFESKEALIISLLIVLSAAAKSAQFPFCFWLPKAMEGPTPSSAIFYGALSIHVGVYVLLRMFPLWSGFWVARVFLFCIGFGTVILSASATRVQSNIKSQIAYSSLIQVGFMFCEISLGLEKLVLIHLMSNAFLRGYQLLVSPSVVSYLIRYHNEARPRQEGGFTKGLEQKFPRLVSTWYLFSLREGYLETILENTLWSPLKLIGREAEKIFVKPVMGFLTVAGGLITLLGVLPSWSKMTELTSFFVAPLAIFLALAALYERGSALRAWVLLGLSQIFIVASVSVSDHFSAGHLLIYLSGIGVCWPLGLLIIRSLPKRELNNYLGFYGAYGRKDFFFLLCCLGLSGFPISPSFLGEDLILHHAGPNKMWLALVIAFCFIICGISAIRIYSRLFLGPPSYASRRSV